jgi:hypothetical protein
MQDDLRDSSYLGFRGVQDFLKRLLPLWCLQVVEVAGLVTFTLSGTTKNLWDQRQRLLLFLRYDVVKVL